MRRLIKEFKLNYIPPQRIFEDTGYVDPQKSYHVHIENVVNRHNQDLKTMVDHGRYFSIFAPRQSGKTTFFRTFAKDLETNPEYIFILMSFENCVDYDLTLFYQTIQDALYDQLIHRLTSIKCHQLETVRQFIVNHELMNSYSFYKLFSQLNKIISQKKIVIFIDEFDGIPLHEIKNFLTTLRKLYQDYKEETAKALYSVGLVGIRNITQLTVGGISPFNIADHVEIPPFTLQNVRDLYLQYTQETNQAFTEDAVQIVFEQTQGQPWLVNRLGCILTRQIKPETTDPIEVDDVNTASQHLLQEKNAHFDNLKEKVLLYKETFNRINAQQVKFLPNDDAQSWLYQYGLIKKENNFAVIANPVYRKCFSGIFDQFNIMRGQMKNIFISYAHDDKIFVDKLIPYLNIVKIHNIDFWYDQKIRTGNDWSAEIQNAIETAHLTICLVSNNYLGSTFVQKREFPAIQTRQKEGMILFPIIIKDCLWKAIPWFKNIQVFPEDGSPLADLSEKELEKKFMALVQQIFDFFEMNQS
jgi:hypothetical protein